MLAATVGSIAIAAAIFGSADRRDMQGAIPTFRRLADEMMARPTKPQLVDGLAWAVPKSDRLETTSGAMVTRYIVQDSIRHRRGAREYLQYKPYARVVARLSAVRSDQVGSIPPFNPVRLYAGTSATREADGSSGSAPEQGAGQVAMRVVELLGSILPSEDGQELDPQEIGEIVNRARLANPELDMRPAFQPDEAAGAKAATAAPASGAEAELALPANTTVLTKSTTHTDDDVAEIEGLQVRTIRVERGETLVRLLERVGADRELARSMAEATRGILSDRPLPLGHVVELALEPSLSETDQMEAVGLSLRDGAGLHVVTITRNSAGEFVANQDAAAAARWSASAREQARGAPASLYAAVYTAALTQGLSADTISQILRLHVYDTDFRRRSRASDELELLFDVREEGRGGEVTFGEMLYSSITSGGHTQRLYRFRSSDGVIDYYDQRGNNSRKFLIRTPIRSEEARLTSGFGMRFHPLLNARRMHTGVDWSVPIGTPIVAAGNGVIEEAGPKGHYGNYIRIRHANGYHTAYAHLSRFAPGIAEGVRVRQNQLIAYSGNTGLSTGPHLHYEVLVNSRFVDPLTIQVPRERRLTGRDLAEFQKERARIESLLRRQPVRVNQFAGL